MLRFKNLSFEKSDQIIYSVLAILLMVATWSLMIFAGVYACRKFAAFEDPAFKKKFGDLFLGLKTNSRVALFSPVLFMLRRIAYAAICVFWFDRSYFQIQFLIFKQSLFMLYTGYFSPN